MEGRLEGHPPPCSRPHCGRERRSAWAPGGAKRGRALAELVGALGWIAVVAIILAILSLLALGWRLWPYFSCRSGLASVLCRVQRLAIYGRHRAFQRR